jgi:DNA-binding IclR family transcriptional regulator
VLKELEAHGWIEQDQDGWKPSVKAQELGNLRSSAVNTSSADFDLGIDGILDSENKQ